jgi:hypothetical protein
MDSIQTGCNSELLRMAIIKKIIYGTRLLFPGPGVGNGRDWCRLRAAWGRDGTSYTLVCDMLQLGKSWGGALFIQ